MNTLRNVTNVTGERERERENEKERERWERKREREREGGEYECGRAKGFK